MSSSNRILRLAIPSKCTNTRLCLKWNIWMMFVSERVLQKVSFNSTFSISTLQHRFISPNKDTLGAFHYWSLGSKLLFEHTNMPCASQIHYPSFHTCDQLCLKHHLRNDLFSFYLNCFVCYWAFDVEVASHSISCPIMTSKLKQLPLFF